MTRFTVGWRGEALQELAEIWLESTDRNSVTAATRDVDDELSEDPLDKGREISEDLYRLDLLPLHVYFVVHEDDRKVEIVKVRGAS
jgi:hypothetical protein